MIFLGSDSRIAQEGHAMKLVRLPLSLVLGLALGLVLGFGAPSASSDEHEEIPSTITVEDLTRGLQTAVRSARTGEFRLMVVATQTGTYVETFGQLEGEQAELLSRKLHALAELVVAEEDAFHEDDEGEDEGEWMEHDEDEDEEDEEEPEEDEEDEDDDVFGASASEEQDA